MSEFAKSAPSEKHRKQEEEDEVEDEEEDEDVCKLCTFSVSGSKAVHQAVYRCDTCTDREGEGDEGRCCCIGCMRICHRGHDVSFVAFGNAFCDCGHGGCALSLSQTCVDEARRVLGLEEGTPHCVGVGVNKDRREELMQLVTQCEPVFTVHEFENVVEHCDYLHEQALHVVNQSKETFWIGHAESARCHFEHLAKSIGAHHMKQQFGHLACFEELLSIAGYEWWIQVKPSPGSSSDPKFSDRGLIGVDLHYDKDEEMAAAFELGIFPLVSTVSYLTNSSTYCHPTVVFDCFASTPVGNPIRECFISFPEVGKHVAFDGRLLHGAPSELLPFVHANRKNVTVTGCNDFRTTFLVNVWVGHHPCAVSPLPQLLVDSLGSLHSSWMLSHPNIEMPLDWKVKIAAKEGYQGKLVKIKEQDTQRDDLGDWITVPFVSNKAEWGKSDDEAGLDLAMWVPQYPIDQYLEMSSTKGRKRRALSNDQSGDDLSRLFETFHFQYIGDNAAARLDYEDEEGEDNFANEFEEL